MEWLLVPDGLVWVFQKLLIYWDFHAKWKHLQGLQRMVQKRENIWWAAVVWTKMPCWCQRRIGRLVRDDRSATVTKITTRYYQGVQNTISERTTRQTLKQMGSSSRRPFSWHTLDPLVPIKHRLNATAYLSIVADHVQPFMTSVHIFWWLLPAG